MTILDVALSLGWWAMFLPYVKRNRNPHDASI